MTHMNLNEGERNVSMDVCSYRVCAMFLWLADTPQNKHGSGHMMTNAMLTANFMYHTLKYKKYNLTKQT